MKRKAMDVINVTSKFYLPFLHYCVCIYVHKNLKNLTQIYTYFLHFMNVKFSGPKVQSCV